MPHFRQPSLLEPIKNYLIMRISECGDTPQLLESERSLCPKFNISRPTLHRAIEELLQKGWCIKLPGRRGVFSNPEKSFAGVREIGVLNSYFYNPNFINLETLSAFLHAFADGRTFTNFIHLQGNTTERRVHELELLALKGIFFCINSFLSPDEKKNTIQLVKALIQRKIPVVCHAYYHLESLDLPSENVVYFDYRKSVQNQLDLARKKHAKKIIFLSSYVQYYQAAKEMSQGLELIAGGGSNMLELIKNLPDMLQKHKPDILIIYGDTLEKRHLLSALNHYDGPFPELFIAPIADTQAVNPCLKKIKIHTINDTSILKEAGKEAAEKLQRLMARS